ncbi:hypothetical protein SAMN05660199_00069 [Klenkia soli]|uniref:Uncharacterized protein n=1 Tax=Klenkia soli TaxID=1052260 RepID=A0A1H0BNH8_9ACTN|nr:hypothetical protein [Klenkia soli]SDN47138.1 hypothetical protein SAMN05660199_00069 [Klenkia soli]
MPYRPIPAARILFPVAFVGFTALGVFFVVISARDDGPPAWFLLLWLAALAWNAYWWLLRTAVEVSVADGRFRWRTPVRSGDVPVDDVLGIGPTRASRQMARIELRDRRPLLVPVRYGFGEVERAIMAAAPRAVVQPR